MSLERLYETFSVSPWLDSLSRELIDSGELQEYTSKGVRGVTSNPTIFADSVKKSDWYTKSIEELASEGLSAEEICWKLAVWDTREAANILRPIYEKSRGQDGFVCLEVSPKHAYDTKQTVKHARLLWKSVSRANLMIKIPATKEGLDAIEKLTAEGINVNATLVFGLKRYLNVMNAYVSGLEARDGSLRHIHSVASFFVSRIDTAIDPLLKHIGTKTATSLRGKGAVAQATAAYGLNLEMFNPAADRWKALEKRGANPQRLLWASTSVKNPDYDPLKYVKGLLLPSTINTMPTASLLAAMGADFEKAEVENSSVILKAHDILTGFAEENIQIDKISAVLEREGVDKFKQSHEELIDSIKNRM